MGIRFILLVNKQGQTRLAQYYEYLTIEQRRALEGEIVRKCLARTENQCSFVEHRNYKIVYRRYASLFFLVGVDNDEASRRHSAVVPVSLFKSSSDFEESIYMHVTHRSERKLNEQKHWLLWRVYCCAYVLAWTGKNQNELAILEFIHLLVETMDRHFGNVCELDIMFHLEKAHFMLEEMVMNGCIVETSKSNILAPVQLMDKAS